MISIEFIKRIESAKLCAAFDLYRDSLKGAKGIRPELCPAIRSYHSIGWKIATPIKIKFLNKRKFYLDVYLNKHNDRLLMPGVIGDKNSDRLYARVDTGFSLKNLPVPLIAIKCQRENDYYSNFEIAPVIYPKNYSGPILIAISSNNNIELFENEYILHILPLSEINLNLIIRDDYEYIENNFEGLLSKDWELKYIHQMKVSSEDILLI